MAIEYPKAKDLKGNEYLLDAQYAEYTPSKKHSPGIIIIPFTSFGVGTRLTFEKVENDIIKGAESDGPIGFVCFENSAVVTDFRREGDKFIIEAQKDTKKEKKMEFVNKIIGRIDMNDNLSDEFFIDMFTNVFTEQQLQNFLNKSKEELEILLFDNLMYLKSDNKAYRL